MSKDWTKSFFQEDIFTPGSPEASAAAADEVKFLWKVLRLKKGSRVLDIPCGTGRHAVKLAHRGASVFGVDITAAYLKQARCAAKNIPTARFARGDMRHLAMVGVFDAAINLWTSFGYFRKPSDDLKTLRGVARALKPGGLFLIDVADFSRVKRLGPTKHWARRADGAYVLEEAAFIGGRDPKVINAWTVLRPGRPARRAHFVVRGYDRMRMFRVLRRAGLKPLKTWKSLGGGLAGTRLVVLAAKTGK